MATGRFSTSVSLLCFLGGVWLSDGVTHAQTPLGSAPLAGASASVFAHGDIRFLDGTDAVALQSLAGGGWLIDPVTGRSDIATLLVGNPRHLNNGNGVYSSATIPSRGIPGRVEIVQNRTLIAYQSGDLPVAGKARTQISSHPTPTRKRVAWDLEFVLGEKGARTGWPMYPNGVHPVTVWQLKSPQSFPSLALSVDSDPVDPQQVMLRFGLRAGTATHTRLAGQARGIERFKPVRVVMEAFLDERTAAQGGEGYWRAWVNGILIFNIAGATLDGGTHLPPQWFLSVYLYNDPLPVSDTWVSHWSKASLFVVE